MFVWGLAGALGALICEASAWIFPPGPRDIIRDFPFDHHQRVALVASASYWAIAGPIAWLLSRRNHERQQVRPGKPPPTKREVLAQVLVALVGLLTLPGLILISLLTGSFFFVSAAIALVAQARTVAYNPHVVRGGVVALFGAFFVPLLAGRHGCAGAGAGFSAVLLAWGAILALVHRRAAA